MSSSESERECLITGFKSGDGNRFDHNDCKVANGDQLHSQFQTNFIHSFEKILTKENILREVYSYARGKRYNSRSTDLFLEAFSRIYKCKLILIDSEREYGESYWLHQRKDHFDLQGDREEYISLEQEEVANDNSRIPKCWYEKLLVENLIFEIQKRFVWSLNYIY